MKMELAEMRKMIKWPDFLGWQKGRSFGYNLLTFPLRIAGMYTLAYGLTLLPVISYKNFEIYFRDRTTHQQVVNQETFFLGKRAEAGDQAAMAELGRLYKAGEGGLGENHCLALEWTDKAARAGDAWAQKDMSWRYFHGFSVTKNSRLSVYWALQAEKSGVPKEKLKPLSAYNLSKYSQQEIEEMKRSRPEDMPPVKIFGVTYLGSFPESISFGLVHWESCRY